MKTEHIIKQLNNPVFQKELFSNPHKTLQSAGINIPDTTKVEVVRNGRDCVNVVMPYPGTNDAMLKDHELVQIVAGEFIGTFSSVAIISGVVAALLAIPVVAGLAIAENQGAISFS